MTREEYVSELKKYLKRLPKDDYENTIEYFNEYFEEAEDEQKVMEELGTPKEAAAELLENLLQEKTGSAGRKEKKERISTGSILLITCLAILAAPLGTPLLIVAGILILMGILIILLSIYIVAVFTISTMAAGLQLIVQGIAMIPVTLAGASLSIGAGLMGIGIGICLCILEIYICKAIALGISKIGQKMLKKQHSRKQGSQAESKTE